MTFISFEYIWFLPAVFLGYWYLCRGNTCRNLWLIGASFLFYGWWDWRFLLLLAATAASSWFCGLWTGKYMASGERKGARAVLTANIVANIGILFLFKYFDFFASSFASLMAGFGLTAGSVTLHLVLPVGISFYTFQAVGYVIDVYRGDIRPCRNFIPYLAYISFFPQLVAGPIERASNLLPQFSRPRPFDYDAATAGLRLMVWGLFKKMVVADNCAPYADTAFGAYQHLGAAQLWIGLLMYTFQIYGDFSGYSDIARGTARLFGIELMQNFNAPYFSRSMSEFWRRWHISLSTWFRDYLYIPLGGNRKGKGRKAANLSTIFLISGLWHGASYNFLVWGAWQALFTVPESLADRGKASHRPHSSARDWAAILFTFFAIMLGWLVFRAPTLHDAWGYLSGLFRFPSSSNPVYFPWFPLIAVTGLLIAEWFIHIRNVQPSRFLPPVLARLWRHRWFRWGAWTAVCLLIALCSGTTQTFVYFQF